MIYDFVTLDIVLGQSAPAQAAVAAYMASPANTGTYLGLWESDIGRFGRHYLLRAYADRVALDAERRALMLSPDPFGLGATLAALSLEAYALFPDQPDVQPGAHGRVYEFREYHQVPGGLSRSIPAWADALPVRQPLSPVLAVMYALDGPPRMLHIVPWQSLDERAAMRKQLAAAGIWPPKGGPQQVAKGEISIAVPVAGSPLA